MTPHNERTTQVKITISKYSPTPDWDAIKNDLSADASVAIGQLLTAAQDAVQQLKLGESKTVSGNVGRITIRKARD